jgi:hypothetical protein
VLNFAKKAIFVVFYATDMQMRVKQWNSEPTHLLIEVGCELTSKPAYLATQARRTLCLLHRPYMHLGPIVMVLFVEEVM